TRRIPFDDVIRGGAVADVADAVQLIRGLKHDRSRTDALHLSVHQRLDGAFLDDDELLVRMLVRWMRRLAGIQRGDVNLELVERGRRLLDDLADEAGFVRLRRQAGPVEDP